MRIEIKNFSSNIGVALRRAGYHFQHQNGEEMSFVKSLASAGFPRFHIYANLKEDSLMLNLHLDQKKETYGDGVRHHGEYAENGPLKEEMERLKNILGN
jgi:hypothetical protein